MEPTVQTKRFLDFVGNGFGLPRPNIHSLMLLLLFFVVANHNEDGGSGSRASIHSREHPVVDLGKTPQGSLPPAAAFAQGV